jgi:trk system potassium uptake protein TrkA
VERLLRILTVPGTTESAEFAGGRVILRAFRVEEDSPLTEAPLSAVRELMPDVFLVTMVRRGEETVVPTGGFKVKVGDVIYVVMRAQVLDRLLSMFRLRRPTSRRVFVYGASEIGLELSARLAERRHDILLLEEDQSACERAAERLPRAVVIHGSPLDRDLLLDLNVGECTFFGLSGSVESNFAAAVVAKRLGADRAVVMASEPEQVALFDRPPIDAVVNPITLSVGAILRSVRAGRVIFLFRLAGNEFEALEVEAEAGCPAVGRPLRDITFPSDGMVAAVIGEDGPRVATGDTVIVRGDHVIALARSRAVNDVVRLFSASGAARSARLRASRRTEGAARPEGAPEGASRTARNGAAPRGEQA